MTIQPLKEQDVKTPEKPPVTVQNELQKEILRQNLTGAIDTQKQLLQLLASMQPMQHVQQTAQNQLSKGYLDIKI